MRAIVFTGLPPIPGVPTLAPDALSGDETEKTVLRCKIWGSSARCQTASTALVGRLPKEALAPRSVAGIAAREGLTAESPGNGAATP